MRILQKGVLSLLAIATISSIYAAQFEITPTIGKKIANDDVTLDDSKALFGIRGTAFVTPNVGIQGVLESSVNNKTVDHNGGVGDTDIERGALNVVLQANGNRVKPYAMAGVGYERTHGISVPTTNDDSQVFYNAGIGLKFGLTDKVNLITEVKGMHKVENDDDDLIGTVGVGVVLGGSASKKPSCDEPKALSLDEFAKMCKTKKETPQETPAQVAEPVMQATQTEPPAPVIDEKTAAVTEPVIEENDNCVVEVDSHSDEGTSVSIPEGYYVQMAALFKGNGEVLTAKLERKNYPYVLYNTERFGKEATLVLVGPYETRKEASVALRYLKRLSRKAFIKRFP